MNNKLEYIKQYNKAKYKMYQFRVRNNDKELISYLNNIENKNNYLISLINKDFRHQNCIYTIREIRNIIEPLLSKHSIKEVYLFGSYARGDANENSDIDIYCEPGDIKTLIDQELLEEELKKALKKDVDIVFTTSTLGKYFENNIREDLIKLCYPKRN